MERAGVRAVGLPLLPVEYVLPFEYPVTGWPASRTRLVNPAGWAGHERSAVRFDIEDYKGRADRLRWDDLDFGAFVDDPLDPDTLRVIEYMHDVELHTICYLRDLLVTPAHNDPDVTTFLSCWAYEELWHGEALGDVLAAHGRPSGAQRVAPLRGRLGVRDRIRPYVSALGSSLVGERLVALHMTWGAVNEWTTQAAYARLSQRAGHPVLAELTRRIARQEGRHIDFYAAEARRRLGESEAARRIVRWALRRLWRPVGSGIMPRSETDFVIEHLYAGPDAAPFVERIDRRIDSLPGMSGLKLISGQRAMSTSQVGRRAGRPAALTSPWTVTAVAAASPSAVSR